MTQKSWYQARDPKKLVPTHPRPTQKRKDKSLCQAQTGRRDGWSSCVFLLFVYIYSRMLTASAKLSSSEQSAAQALREEVAPVLANGVACAMRDQPSDPAGYMAEYLAVAGAGGAASVLDQRKFGQECARLDAELSSLKEQLTVARAERSRRLPKPSDADAQRNMAIASASWAEVRRLKRLSRSIKIKIGEPLNASDWPIPEGVLLVQGGKALGSQKLCAQLAADFGVGHVDMVGEYGGDAALSSVLKHMQAKPTDPVLLQGMLNASTSREQLVRIDAALGRPTALLLLECGEEEHSKRLVDEAALEGSSLSVEAAQAEARQWASDVAALEAAAREAHVPVLRVGVGGDFNAQMTAFLVACTSV